MSPASAGTLEVERYIGACLISQNRVKTKPNHRHHDLVQDVYHKHHVNFHLQRCHSVEGWAGGMPLISFTQHQRGNYKNDQEEQGSLARLAVHTQGAPLILNKSFSHRKNKVNRNHGASKVFENSNNKKVNSVDAVSVTSDESSGSANSETCLPRIIKPRKRRKKDRKPPLLGRPLSQDGFSTDSASPEIDNNQTNLPLSPFSLFNFNPYGALVFPESSSKLDQLHDISETPKLHHSFEDIKEPDGKDLNGNTSTCQCRYCDPSGQIWDVDRECYSPFLTPPSSKIFQFPTYNLDDIPYTTPISTSCLEHTISRMSLEDDKKPLTTSRSSSSSSCRDLEVSTEIVTSLNGHRDLEIKFFSTPSSFNGVRSCETNDSTTKKCAADSELGLVYEE